MPAFLFPEANLQATTRERMRFPLLISNNAHTRWNAKNSGIDVFEKRKFVSREAFNEAPLAKTAVYNVDLVVLAGWLSFQHCGCGTKINISSIPIPVLLRNRLLRTEACSFPAALKTGADGSFVGIMEQRAQHYGRRRRTRG